MPLKKLLLSVSYVGCSGIVFICILQQSFAVGILQINSTVQVNHTNGTVNHTIDTVKHSNETFSHTNETFNHSNETVNYINETANYTNETANHTNETDNQPNQVAVESLLLNNSTLADNSTDFSIGLRSLGKKKYVIVKEKASWIRAMQRCREKNMRLASINNVVQQKLLVYEMGMAGIRSEPVWTSGNDLAQKGNFFWISTGQDFKTSGFTNWDEGEPNNYNWGDDMGVEHCVDVSPVRKYRWSDYTCYAQQYFACEVF